MKTTIVRSSKCYALTIGTFLLAFSAAAHGQSDIVFVTADISPGFQSKLVRFDAGTQTYAVDTGASPAFLGVTILDQEVLVADYIADEIQRFSPAGAYLGPFTSFTTPTFLESDSSESVYTTHFSIGPPIATRFDSSGAVTGTFTHPNMQQLTGVDADAAGNVYVIDNFTTSRLYKFAPDGTFLNSISLGAIDGHDLAIDESGQLLYMADADSLTLGIKIFDISGATPALAGSITTPADIVGVHYAAESGNILATVNGSASPDPRGLEYSQLGVLLREYRPTGAVFAWDITTFVPIPEPNSMILLLVGTLGLGFGTSSRRR